MTQDSRNALDELGLETAAFKVLCYLSFKEAPLKPKDIAKDIDVRASTIRARLTELKKVGLVSATSDGYVSNLTPYDILMKLYRDIKEEFRG